MWTHNRLRHKYLKSDLNFNCSRGLVIRCVAPLIKVTVSSTSSYLPFRSFSKPYVLSTFHRNTHLTTTSLVLIALNFIRTVLIGSRLKTVKFCMGGRFCILDHTHSECETTLMEIMSFRFRNRVKTKKTKKGLHRKLKSFCPRIKCRPKKRCSPQFGTIFGRNLWDLFVLPGPFSSDQPALKS